MSASTDGHTPLEDGVALIPLLRALRKTRDEAQWTQVIAAVAGRDPRFASRLAAAFLGRASRRRAVDAFGDVPHELTCRAEQTLGDKGRVDLLFTDSTGDFALLCELKLHSDYGHDQLTRYLDALAPIRAQRKGLLAVTIVRAQQWEAEVADRPGWLGSLRWADVYGDLLNAVPNDLDVAKAWRSILKLMRKTGDFGPMDFSSDAVLAWARRDEAETALRGLLKDLAPAALGAVRASVGSNAEDKNAGEIVLKGITQQVFASKNRMYLHYAIPAAVEEARLRLQIIVWDGVPHFAVEARYEHPNEDITGDAAIAAATQSLKAQHFAHGRDGTGWY